MQRPTRGALFAGQWPQRPGLDWGLTITLAHFFYFLSFFFCCCLGLSPEPPLFFACKMPVYQEHSEYLAGPCDDLALLSLGRMFFAFGATVCVAVGAHACGGGAAVARGVS